MTLQIDSDDLDADEAGSAHRACGDTSGPPLDCSRLASSPEQDCLGKTMARRVCETWGPSLDAKVGASWLGCLEETGMAGASCDTHRITRCALSALGGACVDGSFRRVCADVARECADISPEITASVCERAVGAFHASERTKIAECLLHGCRTGSFGSCIP